MSTNGPRAFRGTIRGIDTAGIYLADDRQKARRLVWLAATEAGYRVKWTETVCTRAPEYDALAPRHSGVSVEFALQYLEAGRPNPSMP